MRTSVAPVIACTLLVVAVLAAAPGAARAQGREEAARLALEGKRLLDEGRCDEALPRFDASLVLYDHAKTRFLKVVCLEKLDRDLETARELLVSVKGDPELGQYAAELPDLLVAVELKLRPVPLVVSAEGGGVGRVELDGELVGVTPWTGTTARGRHEVRVHGDGCDPAPKSVQAAADPLVLAFRCEPVQRDATLDVRSDSPGVRVVVDEATRGTTPLAAPIRVTPGERRVLLEKPGHIAQRRSVVLSPGEHIVLDVTLIAAEEEGGIHPAWAWATLGTGAALALTGTGFLIRHGVDLSRARGETDTHFADTVSPTNGIIGGVTLGVGAALVVTSFFLWPDDDDAAAGERPFEGLSVSAGPDGAAVDCTLRF